MDPRPNDRAIQELIDRQAIHDCLMTYSRAVDRLDRELLLSVYHPDAVDDHGVFVGNREEFADWVIAMHTRMHLSQQHCQFNSTCDLQGDTAHTETYYMFVGMNRKGTPLAMSGGRYIDRLEKRNRRWAIAARVCVRDWAPRRTGRSCVAVATSTYAVNLELMAKPSTNAGEPSLAILRFVLH